MPHVQPWRFRLGWAGWRELIARGDSCGHGPVQLIDSEWIDLRIQLLERGKGAALSHRDLARRMTLELTTREAEALIRSLTQLVDGQRQMRKEVR